MRPAYIRREKRGTIYTVSRITALIRDALETGFTTISVEGEVSNLRRPSSGHLYFTLKDDRSQLRCVLFRGYGQGLRFQPKDGSKVIATGTLTVYEARGEYQLRVERMRPAGLGELSLAFLQLRDRLQAEGLFDADRKLPLPKYPETVCLITSRSGAAVRDMVRILRRRWPALRIVLRPTPVQGDGAALSIARAIDEVSSWGGADVILLGRGGGSLEDLWAFNEEIVARAIARATTPVISAVGHEIDFTIADFVADRRAATPSAAAEQAVAVAAEVAARLAELHARMIRALTATLDASRRAVGALSGSRSLGRPQDVMDQTRQRLDDFSQRMALGLVRVSDLLERSVSELARRLATGRPTAALRASRGSVEEWSRRLAAALGRQNERAAARLEAVRRQLEALGPQEVLDRGFCIALRSNGSLLKEAAEAPAGTGLELVLARGRLGVRSEGMVDGRGETVTRNAHEH